MFGDLKELISISKFYGSDKDYVIAGGGNTSVKDADTLHIKASGISLGDIDEKGFVALKRSVLKKTSTNRYSSDPFERESQVKNDLAESRIFPELNQRPSVETSLHEIIEYKFVVHTHPWMINAVLCSKESEEKSAELFGEDVLFVKYADPGYILFKKVYDDLVLYRKKFNKEPHVILLENHGVIVAADSTEEIKKIYQDIVQKVMSKVEKFNVLPLSIDDRFKEIIPSVEKMVSFNQPKKVVARNNTLISYFCQNKETFNKISLPFIPDNIVYCKSRPLFIETSAEVKETLDKMSSSLTLFTGKNGYLPKIIVIQKQGILAVEDNRDLANTVLEVFEDLMKISYYSCFFGGPKFMTLDAINFIDTWEIENYRRHVARSKVWK